MRRAGNDRCGTNHHLGATWRKRSEAPRMLLLLLTVDLHLTSVGQRSLLMTPRRLLLLLLLAFCRRNIASASYRKSRRSIAIA